MATGLGVQNHAYGGASAADNEALPGANLYARIRDSGQFFVSGTIALQLEDYIGQTLAAGRVERADTTAFLIWAGANDYISKEPVTGLITTFLNSPEGESGYKTVAESAVAAIAEHLRTLYRAGARRFVVLNLPDLGHTPIVLQNTTYVPDYLVDNDIARRLELAHRLTRLTDYHNKLLAQTLAGLRAELAGADLLLVDTHAFFRELTGDDPAAPLRPVDFGYDPAALAETLQFDGDRLRLQGRCYRGAYVGTPGPEHVCPAADKALFWDTVHPTTLTHCWQAWHVGTTMAAAGWIRPLPEAREYLGWCQAIVGEVTLNSVSDFTVTPGD